MAVADTVDVRTEPPPAVPERRARIRGRVQGSLRGEPVASLAIGVGSLAFSGWFIARAAVRISGVRTFILFDDAMISMRYAENLANGDGLVWNPAGERVEGITNPLWTAWMAVLHLLPVGPMKQSLLVMLSGAALVLATLWIVRRLAVELAPDDPVVVVTSVALAGTFYPLVFWSVIGMEVGLVAWLIGVVALGILRLVRDPDDWRRRDTVVLALATLALVATRLDSVVAVGALAVGGGLAAGGRGRIRVALHTGVPLVGGLVLLTAARVAYYGDWLPNTYYLKATGMPLGERVDQGAEMLGVVTVAHLAVFGVAVVFGLLRPTPAGAWMLVSVGAGQAAYSVWVGGDAWESSLIANRYLTVAIAPLAVVAGIGLCRLRQATPLRFVFFVLVAGAVMARVLVARHWRSTGDPLMLITSDDWMVRRSGVHMLGALVLVLVGLALWRLVRAVSPGLVVAVATAVVVLLTNLQPLTDWSNGPRYGVMYDRAQVGWAVRHSTEPDAEIAVWGAGAEVYFADRTAVDLLGKSDRHIARLDPRGGMFVPGHNKYDLDWSLTTYEPDLVQVRGSVGPSPFDAALREHGYEVIGGLIWVHRASTKVDRARLRSLLADQSSNP